MQQLILDYLYKTRFKGGETSGQITINIGLGGDKKNYKIVHAKLFRMLNEDCPKIIKTIKDDKVILWKHCPEKFFFDERIENIKYKDMKIKAIRTQLIRDLILDILRLSFNPITNIPIPLTKIHIREKVSNYMFGLNKYYVDEVLGLMVSKNIIIQNGRKGYCIKCVEKN
jgi:hypothetical protein